jgi:hypothetical protein
MSLGHESTPEVYAGLWRKSGKLMSDFHQAVNVRRMIIGREWSLPCIELVDTRLQLRLLLYHQVFQTTYRIRAATLHAHFGKKGPLACKHPSSFAFLLMIPSFSKDLLGSGWLVLSLVHIWNKFGGRKQIWTGVTSLQPCSLSGISLLSSHRCIFFAILKQLIFLEQNPSGDFAPTAGWFIFSFSAASLVLGIHMEHL